MSNYGGDNPYGSNDPYGSDPYGSGPTGGSPYGSPFGAPPPADPMGQPLRGATIGTAYSRFWKKYAVFSGRASRSEFWWVYLINAIISLIVNLAHNDALTILGGLYSLATIVPSLALGARRLHDVNRSGWWQLLAIIPIIGWIILIVWWATTEKKEGVRFDAGVPAAY